MSRKCVVGRVPTELNSELDSEEESRDDITGSLIPRENLEQIRESGGYAFGV